MTNKEAISFLKNMSAEEAASAYNKTGFAYQLAEYHVEALHLAVLALESQDLNIRALKRDLPELFKPEYDGGYLLEGVEE